MLPLLPNGVVLSLIRDRARMENTSAHAEKGVQVASHAPENTGPALTTNGHLRTRLGAFEQQLLKYNIEIRGIQRVGEHEKVQVGWLAYLQVFVLWISSAYFRRTQGIPDTKHNRNSQSCSQ